MVMLSETLYGGGSRWMNEMGFWILERGAEGGGLGGWGVG